MSKRTTLRLKYKRLKRYYKFLKDMQKLAKVNTMAAAILDKILMT